MLTLQSTPTATIQTVHSGHTKQTASTAPQYPVITSYDKKSALKDGYKPTEFDVLCTRGNAVKSHPGNIRLFQMIDENLQAYSSASSKLEKSLIVSSIIDAVRRSSPEGGFVKQEGGRWYEVGDHYAREKVGQRLRNLLSNKYSSSSSAKKRRRRANEDVMIQKMDQFIIAAEELNLTDRLQELASNNSAATDDELQAMFNQANVGLLQKIKEQNLCSDQSNHNNSYSSLSSTATTTTSSSSKNKRKFYDTESDDESSASFDDDSSFDPLPFDYSSI